MTFRALVPLVLAAGLMGCVGTLTPVEGGGDDVGGPDAGGGGGGAAETQFNTSVAPLLTAACASCHAGTLVSPPKFLGAGGATNYYDAITRSTVVGTWNAATASLITKGLHDGGNARAWLQNEIDTITAWMNAEAAER